MVYVSDAAQVPLISVSPISSSEEYRAGQKIALSCTTPTGENLTFLLD